MQITVILLFTPKIETEQTVHNIVDMHKKIEDWTKTIQNSPIGAQFKIDTLECFSGNNPFWDEDRERMYR